MTRLLACVVFSVLSVATCPAAAPEVLAGAPPGSRMVTFTTDDNLVIHALYVPPPASSPAERAPVVFLVHMYRSNHKAFLPLLAPLREAGFAIVAMDLRGHGESINVPEMKLAQRVEQRDRKLFEAMDRDVEAAYFWVVEQPGIDPSRIALVGASVGASIALDYAARDKSVDAVVCLTPGAGYLGLDSMAAVEKYGRRPLLLVAAETEKLGAEQLARAAPEAKIRFLASSATDTQALHGTRMLGKVPGLEKEMVQFLQKGVGPATRELVTASLKGQVYYAPESSMASHLSKRNVRWYSSPAEAEQRGLHPPRSSGSRRSGSRTTRGTPSGGVDSFPDQPNP